MEHKTERYQLRQELRELRDQLDRQLFSFVEACSIVNSNLDETKLLYSIVDVAVNLTMSRHGHVLLIDPEQPEALLLRASKGRRREGLLNEVVPAGKGVAHLVMGGGESIMTNEAQQDSRFQWRPQGATEKVHKLLCVPVTAQDGQVIGAIELHDRIDGEYSPKDLQFMEMLAYQAGSCITSSRLFARVQEDRRWISSIVDSMNDGVVVTDWKGRVVLANETARALFNLDEEHRPPNGDLNLTLLMEEVAKLDDGETFDYFVLKPVPEMLSVRTTVLKDSDGQTRAIILGMRNVKELKETERKNLEFLSLVSHELETHFGSLEHQLPDHIERGAAEVSDLISNLVYYSEIESGPIRLERRVEDPYELIQAAAEDLARQFQARSIEFELLKGKSTSVLVDPDRIVNLVKGILRYVISAAGEGSKVQVRVVPSAEIRGEVRIEFDIEGLALSDKDIDDLFNKTYQVENYISILGRQTTGLGFVFLKHIAEAHGGAFAAERLDEEKVRFSVKVRR